ncbi:MAG: hypothetical protein GX593_12000, partial [Actinomycetales bacterium]|nr:hypothetical protein [Actinomycetales bacterium]
MERGSRRSGVTVGALMLAIGLAMLVLARASAQVVVLLAAAGLIVAGAGRLLGVREPGPWRARWLDVVLGVGLLAAGGIAALWHTAPLRVLAWVLAGMLVASGLAAVVQALRAPSVPHVDDALGPIPGSERVAGVLGGTASVVVGVLVLFWPRLSLAVFALVVGFWLTFAGLGTLLGALRGHRTARRRTLSDDGAPGNRAPGRTPTLARPPARSQLAMVRSGLALLLALALAAATVAVHNLDLRDEPDSFYTAPLAVPGEPGRLVRAEPMPADRVPDGLRGWRILYTSTSGGGEPTVVSGTVLAPPVGTPPARAENGGGADDGAPGGVSTAMPVISVAHGTTGIIPRCAPSLADDPFADGAGAALEQIVTEGWVGVTSDYVGLGTPGPHGYLVGPDAAHDVLDATRAARELEGLELSGQTVVWGHSQGGHGALWTGMLAPEYAPELDLLGVAAFAPAADLYPLAQGVRATTGGKLVSAYIAASWTRYYPGFELSELVAPGYVGLVHRIEGHCFNGANALGAFAIASQL